VLKRWSNLIEKRRIFLIFHFMIPAKAICRPRALRPLEVNERERERERERETRDNKQLSFLYLPLKFPFSNDKPNENKGMSKITSKC